MPPKGYIDSIRINVVDEDSKYPDVPDKNLDKVLSKIRDLIGGGGSPWVSAAGTTSLTTDSDNVFVGPLGVPRGKLHIRNYSDQLIIEDSDGSLDEKLAIIKNDSGRLDIVFANDDWTGWALAMSIKRTGLAIDDISFTAKVKVDLIAEYTPGGSTKIDNNLSVNGDLEIDEGFVVRSDFFGDTAGNGIIFEDSLMTQQLPIADTINTELTGFTADSIIGALNELKASSGGLSEIIFNDVYKEFSFSGTPDSFIRATFSNIYGKQFIRNTWISSGSLNTGRAELAGCGSQNSAVSFGGFEGTQQLVITEKFDGSIWKNSGNCNTESTRLAGCGIQNAALKISGQSSSGYTAVVEKFNGSTWATVNSLNTARCLLAASGIQNAALSFAGFNGASLATTEKFDGVNWVATGNLNSAGEGVAGAGTQNAAFSFGAFLTPEKFNNASWITSQNLNTGRQYPAGSGTQNRVVCSGGESGSVMASTEKYIDTAWYVSNSLNVARSFVAGCGSQNSSLSFGGTNDLAQYLTTTEKFIGDAPFGLNTICRNNNDYYSSSILKDADGALNIKIPAILSCELLLDFNSGITEEERRDLVQLEKLDYGDGVWSLTGILSSTKYSLAGAGTQNTALAFGGIDTAVLSITEKFNGTNWNTTGALNVARRTLVGAGTQNSALSFGGLSGSNLDTTEKFNGTNWAVVNPLNSVKNNAAGSGVQNAALSFGGATGSGGLSITEKFDGTNWTLSSNLNSNNYSHCGFGSQNNALSNGGTSAKTEKFNGFTWTIGNSMNVNRIGLAGSGCQSMGLNFGGAIAAPGVVNTEKYTNAGWKNTGDLGTGRANLAGCGSQNSALSFGGSTIGSRFDITEKFNTQLSLPFVGLEIANVVY